MTRKINGRVGGDLTGGMNNIGTTLSPDMKGFISKKLQSNPHAMMVSPVKTRGLEFKPIMISQVSRSTTKYMHDDESDKNKMEFVQIVFSDKKVPVPGSKKIVYANVAYPNTQYGVPINKEFER